jgi:xanthine dehydrogenase YagR molybdenum-binding subunit
MNNQFNTSYFPDERVDGLEKVTGKARYTAEHQIANMAYAVFICSTIARGKVKKIDSTNALTLPGAIDVMHVENCPKVPGYKPSAFPELKNVGEWRGMKVFGDNLVRFYGQPVALALAESIESANEVAKMVEIEYETEPHETDFHTLRKDPSKLKNGSTYSRGKSQAYKEAPFYVEAEYNIPIEVHNPMEMHATIAHWETPDTLLLYDKTQGPKATQSAVARLFGLPDKNVRIIAENVGGAFGSALRSWPNVSAAVIAAKKINRPVKLVLTRPQMFTLVGYRPQAWQQVGVGADAQGNLLGISHYAISNTSRYEDFREGIVDASKFLYKCDNVDTDYKLLPLDLSTPTWMRGPGEATGCFALECSLDDLAFKLKMDPIQFRIKNFTDIQQESKLAWSAINVKDCYAKGAELIGWKNRKQMPKMLKEGDWYVGYGMGVGVFGAGRGTSTVRAVLRTDGQLLLESAVSDMGSGTATAMVKVAASAMKLPEDKIKFVMGDSDLPPGPMQGGSTTTSTLGSGVHLVCESLKDLLKNMAIESIDAFKSIAKENISVENNKIFVANNSTLSITVKELLDKRKIPSVEIIKTSPGLNTREIQKATNSFSVHFVKLHVHSKTGEIQLKHIVTTGDAGKIISEQTARSQMLGGAVGGIGMALTEEVKIDHATGKISNASLGSYLVPRHVMIPHIDVWFTNKPDPYINAIGAKGLGEIAIIGFAAAVSNAVFNATGKRMRDLPITKEKVLAAKA